MAAHRFLVRAARGPLAGLCLVALVWFAAAGVASAASRPAAPPHHIVDASAGLSFDLPGDVRPVAVSSLHGTAGKDLRFFAVRARRDGVVVEDVLVSVYPGRLFVTVPALRSLLSGPGSQGIDVHSARVAFGRVLAGSVAVRRSGKPPIYSTIYLFYRDARTYAVAFNGLTRAGNAALASVVMGSWGRSAS